VKKRLTFSFPPLIPVILSLITGIMAGNFFPAVPLGIFAAISLGFMLAASFFLFKLKSFVICISFLSMVWGFFSIAGILKPDPAQDSISQFADSSRYTITGEIVSFSKDYFRRKRVIIFCRFIERKGVKLIRVKGRILLNIYNIKNKNAGVFQYGDLIRFTSTIKPFRNFSNPNGFDYEKYMKYAGVSGSAHAKAAMIRVIPAPVNFHIKIIRVLEEFRNRFCNFTFDRMDNKNAAAILTALVTGKKEAIPLKIKDLFSEAGASHILAISGLHLSIVALGFFLLFYFFLAMLPMLLIQGAAKKIAGIMTLIPLFLYGIFSGFSPSTQRAFIMTTLFMISFLMEKENNPLNTLALAAVVILFIDSTALFSISFQLSFGALLSIFIGFSLIRVWGFVPKNKFMSMVITPTLVTLFAGVGTFPLVAHYFNLVSCVQIFSNLVLIPLMGFVCLPLGFLALLSFPLVPFPAEILVNFCQSLLCFCINYIQFLTSFRLSWSRITTFDSFMVILVYSFLTAIGFYLFRYRKTGLVLMTIAVLTGFVNFTTGFRAKLFPKNMVITILDVGQGNAALIQTIEGKNILVDGGGFSDISSFDIGRYVVGPFLWSKKIICLDAVILTHPESDHMNGLLYILDNFKVKLLVKNRDTRSSRTYKEFMALCHGNKIRIWHPSAIDNRLDFGHTFLIFFRGPPRDFSRSLNNNSLVFQVRLDQFALLFPGDILNERERALASQAVQGPNLKSSLLLSPHHGSLTSSSNIFLDKVNPESVIISCGFGNQYGFPHHDVLKRYKNRGCRVFRTDLNGAVTILSDGTGYNILTHKGG